MSYNYLMVWLHENECLILIYWFCYYIDFGWRAGVADQIPPRLAAYMSALFCTSCDKTLASPSPPPPGPPSASPPPPHHHELAVGTVDAAATGLAGGRTGALWVCVGEPGLNWSNEMIWCYDIYSNTDYIITTWHFWGGINSWTTKFDQLWWFFIRFEQKRLKK